MQIIVSHDIDHISASEHVKDLFLLKYIVRNTVELCSTTITTTEYKNRVAEICRNQLNHIKELTEFDIENGVKPTFFIAVKNGKSLSYGSSGASFFLNYFKLRSIPVGVHGINYNSLEKINNELKKFRDITNLDSTGIRMHYLRTGVNTLKYLEQAGYIFDSTDNSFINPYKAGKLWEFPIHLMDTFLLYGKSKFQKKSLDLVKEETIKLVEKAESYGLEYFTVVTHDFYFSDSFTIFKSWYIWLINYFKSKGCEFISFEDAIKKLNYI